MSGTGNQANLSVDTQFEKAPGGSNQTTPSATPTIKRPTPLIGRWGDYAWDNFCAADEGDAGGPGAVGTPLVGKSGVPPLPDEAEESSSPKLEGNNTAQPSPRGDEAKKAWETPSDEPPQATTLLEVSSQKLQEPPAQKAPKSQPQAPHHHTDPAREAATPEFSAPTSYNNRVPQGGGGMHQPQAQPGAFAGPGISSPPSTTMEPERTGSTLTGLDFSASQSRQQSTMSIGSNAGNRTQHAPYQNQNQNQSRHQGGGNGGKQQGGTGPGAGTSRNNSMVTQSALLPPGLGNSLDGGSLAGSHPGPSGQFSSGQMQQGSQQQHSSTPSPVPGSGGNWNAPPPSGHHFPGSGGDHSRHASNNSQQQYQHHHQNTQQQQQQHQQQQQQQHQQGTGWTPGAGAMAPAAHFGAPGGQTPPSMFGMPPGAPNMVNQHMMPGGPGWTPPQMPPSGMFNPVFNSTAGQQYPPPPPQQQQHQQPQHYQGHSGTTPQHVTTGALANGGTNGAYAPVQITRFPPPPPPSARSLQILESDGSEPGVGRTIAKRWYKKQLSSQMAHPQIPPCPEPDFSLHSLENWLRVSGEWWKLNYADMKTSALHGPPSCGPAPQPGSSTRRRKEGQGNSQPGSQNNRSQPGSQPGSRNNRMPQPSSPSGGTPSQSHSLPPSQPGSRNNRTGGGGGAGGGSQPGSRNNRQPRQDQHTPHSFVMNDFRSNTATPGGATGGGSGPPTPVPMATIG